MSVEANKIDLNVKTRVQNAVRTAMDIYMNKLLNNYIDVGLENTFQMHLGEIVGRELDQNTFHDDERFIVKFEKNMPINNNKDYIDIVIEYKRKQQIKLYLMELKFKKVSDSAPDLGNIESYKDIYNLDCHKNNKDKNNKVDGCFFIFLTNYDTYLKQSNVGTRTEIPMYDGYTILANHNYKVTGNAALKSTKKYEDGFTFKSNYYIEYKHMHMENVETEEKDYWYFFIEM